MEHFCEYHSEPRKVGTQYDSTNTFVIKTTYVSVQVCCICGKPKPKTPCHEFVSIRSNYDFDLIMGYKIIEEIDICNERPPTCDWRDFIPLARKEDSLLIRISKIEERNCQCKSCDMLKCYVDFIEDQR